MVSYSLFARTFFTLALGYLAMNANADDDLADSITEYSVTFDELYDEIVVAHRQGDSCHLIISHSLGSYTHPAQSLKPSVAIILPETIYRKNSLFSMELWPASYSLNQNRLLSPSLDQGVVTHEPLQEFSPETLIQMSSTEGDQRSGFPLALPIGPIEIQNQDQLYVIDPILKDPTVTISGSTASSSVENEPASRKRPASGKSAIKEASRPKLIRTESHAKSLTDATPGLLPPEEESSHGAASERSTISEHDHYHFHITGQLLLGIEPPRTSKSKKKMREKTVTIPVTILVSANTAEGTAQIDSLSSNDSKYAINIFRKPPQASSSVKLLPDNNLQETWKVVKRRAIRKIREELIYPKVFGVSQIIESYPSSDAKTIWVMPKIKLQVIDENDSISSVVNMFIESSP
ncbi:hypothetical protein [Endozoicomonas sp. SESOKO2]|uniref:hypothetical protein n=2 Tax=unclassified Endozoicomonas TaxID=2644528 RepID=UPI002149275F|nr:hypothetical protein [Endozoicomonas sp. SESOKO2]